MVTGLEAGVLEAGALARLELFKSETLVAMRDCGASVGRAAVAVPLILAATFLEPTAVAGAAQTRGEETVTVAVNTTHPPSTAARRRWVRGA